MGRCVGGEEHMKRRGTAGRLASATALAGGLLWAGAPLRAQEAPAPDTPPADAAPPEAPPTETVEGPRTFTPEDFTRFAPRNALDMLRQVPGFVIREAIEERGLGQATGNVLINDQRVSGKSDDIATRLSRIPAGNVIRIEIRD